MTARDDYAKLHANTSGPHHQGQTSREAQAALDKIDQLHGALASLAAEYDRLAQRAYNAGAAVLELPLLEAWTALGVSSIPAGVR